MTTLPKLLSKKLAYIDLLFPEDQAYVQKKTEILIQSASSKGLTIEYRLITSDRQVIWIYERSFLKYNAANQMTHVQGVVINMTTQKNAQTVMDPVSDYDELTGLKNRLALRQALNKRIAGAKQGETFALLALDMNHFQKINDSFGDQVGDQILIILAKRLQAFSDAESIFLARKANDDFIFLSQSYLNLDQIQALAKSILHCIRVPIEIAQATYRLTASLGIALYPNDGKSANALLSSANAAVYQAKAFGRDYYLFYDIDRCNQNKRDFKLIAELYAAYESEQFVLLSYSPMSRPV